MTLKKKLQLLKSIYWVRNFLTYYDREIRSLYKNDKISLIENESGFADKFDREFKKFDLKDEKLWCTYEECISGEITLEQDKVKITIYCNNGDWNGYPTTRHWTAVFVAEIFTLSIFKDLINSRWSLFLENKFQEDEERRKLIRIKEIERELLK